MFITEPIGDDDPGSGFSCGEPALDTFFARHALPNDRRGLGRTFVLRRRADRLAIRFRWRSSDGSRWIQERKAFVWESGYSRMHLLASYLPPSRSPASA